MQIGSILSALRVKQEIRRNRENGGKCGCILVEPNEPFLSTHNGVSCVLPERFGKNIRSCRVVPPSIGAFGVSSPVTKFRILDQIPKRSMLFFFRLLLSITINRPALKFIEIQGKFSMNVMQFQPRVRSLRNWRTIAPEMGDSSSNKLHFVANCARYAVLQSPRKRS